ALRLVRLQPLPLVEDEPLRELLLLLRRHPAPVVEDEALGAHLLRARLLLEAIAFGRGDPAALVLDVPERLVRPLVLGVDLEHLREEFLVLLAEPTLLREARQLEVPVGVVLRQR